MKTFGVTLKIYGRKKRDTPTNRNTLGGIDRYKSQKNVHRKDRLSNLFSCETDLVYITSDSYCDTIPDINHMKVSPRTMDFLTFDGSWNQDEGRNKSSTNISQSNNLWTFIDFDSSKQGSKDKSKASNSHVKSPKVPDSKLTIHHIPIDGADKTKPLTNILGLFKTKKSKRNSIAPVKTQVCYDHFGIPSLYSLKKKLGRAHLRVKSSELSSPTTLSCSTESLSDDDDDDDSFWTDLSSQQYVLNDFSIRYSQRSEISSASQLKVMVTGKMFEQSLNPNQSHLYASYWAEQNRRPYMEDRFIVEGIGSIPSSSSSYQRSFEPISIYGIFDGHAGSLASQYCSDFFSSYLTSDVMFHTDLPRALKSTFSALDNDFISTGNNDGTTACVTLVVGKKKVICANAGDSRAIIIQSDGSIVCLSRDHKPNMPEETKRIHRLGGRIMHVGTGTWRVEGRLAVSRSIGDASLKPFVSSSE
jgi:serine/threonine protein phosphatase PrpC